MAVRRGDACRGEEVEILRGGWLPPSRLIELTFSEEGRPGNRAERVEPNWSSKCRRFGTGVERGGAGSQRATRYVGGDVRFAEVSIAAIDEVAIGHVRCGSDSKRERARKGKSGHYSRR